MLCKKGVEELLLNATTPHVRDGKMREHGGWAMGSEEGGRGREGKKKGEAGSGGEKLFLGVRQSRVIGRKLYRHSKGKS